VSAAKSHDFRKTTLYLARLRYKVLKEHNLSFATTSELLKRPKFFSGQLMIS
jgi:hypothetical protein